jgi:hypothetical protein
MPYKRKSESNSNKTKKSKSEKTNDFHLQTNVPNLPWDLWGFILGNLSFLELRKSCFRVCKRFHEFTFQVVQELSLREKEIKNWRQIMQEFGKKKTKKKLTYIHLASRTDSQHINLKSLDLAIDKLKNEDLQLFPPHLLKSITRLNASRVNNLSKILAQCPNLIRLNALSCFPILPYRLITPNLISLVVRYHQNEEVLPQDIIPTSLQMLKIHTPLLAMKEVVFPTTLKLLHWKSDSYYEVPNVLSLPSSIEDGAIDTIQQREAELLLESLPSSLLKLKFRYFIIYFYKRFIFEKSMDYYSKAHLQLQNPELFRKFTRLQTLELCYFSNDFTLLPTSITKLDLVGSTFSNRFYQNLPTTLKQLTVSGDMPKPKKVNHIPKLEIEFNNKE